MRVTVSSGITFMGDEIYLDVTYPDEWGDAQIKDFIAYRKRKFRMMVADLVPDVVFNYTMASPEERKRMLEL